MTIQWLGHSCFLMTTDKGTLFPVISAVQPTASRQRAAISFAYASSVQGTIAWQFFA